MKRGASWDTIHSSSDLNPVFAFFRPLRIQVPGEFPLFVIKPSCNCIFPAFSSCDDDRLCNCLVWEYCETAVASSCLVCYTAVFSVVTQRSSGALRDDTKNGCVADYIMPGCKLIRKYPKDGEFHWKKTVTDSNKNRLERSPWSSTHVFKKIEITIRWNCMSKALHFLQITAEHQDCAFFLPYF